MKPIKFFYFFIAFCALLGVGLNMVISEKNYVFGAIMLASAVFTLYLLIKTLLSKK